VHCWPTLSCCAGILPGGSGDYHCPNQDWNWANPEFVSSVISSTKLVVIPQKNDCVTLCADCVVR